MSEAKSRRMGDKQNFLRKFGQCSNELQQIFTQTRDRALVRCVGTDWGYTNKPDFRFSLNKTQNRNWETYAELLFKQRGLFCNLRIDGMNRETLRNSVETIQFHASLGRLQRPGENLVSFAISESQIDDAVSLISQVFTHHLANN